MSPPSQRPFTTRVTVTAHGLPPTDADRADLRTIEAFSVEHGRWPERHDGDAGRALVRLERRSRLRQAFASRQAGEDTGTYEWRTSSARVALRRAVAAVRPAATTPRVSARSREPGRARRHVARATSSADPGGDEPEPAWAGWWAAQLARALAADRPVTLDAAHLGWLAPVVAALHRRRIGFNLTARPCGPRTTVVLDRDEPRCLPGHLDVDLSEDGAADDDGPFPLIELFGSDHA